MYCRLQNKIKIKNTFSVPGIDGFFKDEYYLKLIIIVNGILYWLYGLMPVIDKLFDVISLLSIWYLFTSIFLDHQFDAKKLFSVLAVLCGFVTTLITPFRTVNLIALLYASVEFFLFLYCSPKKSERQLLAELDHIILTVVLLGTVILLLSDWTYFAGYKEVYYYPDITTTTLHLGKDETTGALVGIMCNANITSDFCVIYIGCALYLLEKRKEKLPFIICLLIGFLTLLLTFSRGGYIGAIVMICLYVGLKLCQRAGNGKNAAILLVFFVLLAFLGAIVIFLGYEFFIASVSNRSTTQMQNSTSLRMLLWEAGLKTALSDPLRFFFGVGVEIKNYVALYANRTIEEGLYNNMHNVYMQTLVGFGSVGLLLLLLVIVSVLKDSVRHIWNIHYTDMTILVSLSIALMVINLVESDFYMKKGFEGTVFWMIIGYTYSIVSHRRQKQKET